MNTSRDFGQPSSASTVPGSGYGAAWLAMFLFVASSCGLAQGPVFEVASIRPSDGKGPGSLISALPLAGGQLRMINVSLRQLIQRAFGAADYAVIAPQWMDGQRFDIIAKVPASTWTPKDIDNMLQDLLIGRFHLKTHEESRSENGFELVSTQHVLLKAADPQQVGGRSSGRALIAGTGMSTQELAKALSNILLKPVKDSTQLAGLYDLRLVWRPDDPSAETAASRAGSDLAELPSLFTAIQEQLGLRLRAARVPVTVIVVESADRNPEG